MFKGMAGLILLGAMALLAIACAAPGQESEAGAPQMYEPRAFSQVNPGTVDFQLVAPPNVSPHPDCSGEPRNVKFTLETREYEAEIAPGVTYQFLSFNGAVPGPAIVVCLGDWVEVTLRNPADSKHAHNIDFHAATSALGGGGVSIVGPGQQSTFRFQAIREGVFVYHCAIPPIPLHVTSGMYGAIIVLPREGLPPVDREFYLMEGDFYTEPSADNPARHVYSTARVSDENPSYVVTNGKVGALTGDNALQVRVGEKARFYYGQANLPSWPHIIGGHLDVVYSGGSFHPDSAREYGVETAVVAAGSAIAFEYTFRYPGLYLLVNHELIKATEKGQAVHIMVTGDPNPDLMNVVSPIGPIN